MTMTFCISCPLITPFGCLYFITKHYVDRHNIFFVYNPSKINKKVHATAISFVVLSTIVLQFFMTILGFFRGSADITQLSIRSKYAIGLFLVSVNIFSAQLWSDTCKKFSPIEFMECTLVREQDLYQPDYDYLPDILKDNYVQPRFQPDDPQEAATVKPDQESSSASSPRIAKEDYGTFEHSDDLIQTE